MRVLLDHNVPHRLRGFLPEHEVRTADEMAWAELVNGDLLRAAEDAGFAAMVTADKNISYQQNLHARKLALVVLGTNDWQTIKADTSPIRDALERVEPNSFQTIPFSRRAPRLRRPTTDT